jgi:hypothetical protein
MDQEMKAYLDAKFAECATKTDLAGFATKKDLSGFATKTDLAGLATKTDLSGFATKTDLAGFATKKDLEKDLQALEDRLLARIEKVETSLLIAFHGWARPMAVRVNNVTTIVMGFEERLALAEQRISELERRRAS